MQFVVHHQGKPRQGVRRGVSSRNHKELLLIKMLQPVQVRQTSPFLPKLLIVGVRYPSNRRILKQMAIYTYKNVF